MPACKDCKWILKDGCGAPAMVKRRRSSPVRHCIGAILESMISEARGNVLEVGPGNAHALRRNLVRKREQGTDVLWFGIEPRWGDERKNLFKGSVGRMPFVDGFFDMVCSICSMEHWHEKRDSVEKGIAECRRVLKPGGTFWSCVPIHYHGDWIFIRGEMRTIKRMFRQGWGSVHFDAWRKDYEPLEPFRPWKTALGTDRPARIEKAVMESSRQKVPSSWLLEIKAVKE